MASITLVGVQKDFGGEPILKSCDLKIEDHEFLVLVGPSGSGKTTLLRIISGLETATAGDIYFDDTLVNGVDVGDRDIAMVFQNYGLYPHMSVYQNMAFGLKRRKISKPEIDAKVRAAAELLGIGAMLERRPRQLSGGQRQRVALGRAIVRDPSVFLLDEPLSNLDAHLRTQMRAEILRIHRSVTATAVYVTHDQVEALTMGDRIAVMSDGVIQQIDTPERLYDKPANQFVAGFIGTPPMGFVTAVVHWDGDVARARSDWLDVQIPPEVARLLGGRPEVVVGVRPESYTLTGEANGSGASRIDGVVDVIEPLGAEQHVIIRCDDARLTTRLPRRNRMEVGTRATFELDDQGIHFFDTATGKAIREDVE
ncbi:sn-glycerol-3-phosphate ABC transporter ATP-binding protein UgpC [Intrasporangium mesophilum]